jgi:hypothetical protein
MSAPSQDEAASSPFIAPEPLPDLKEVQVEVAAESPEADAKTNNDEIDGDGLVTFQLRMKNGEVLPVKVDGKMASTHDIKHAFYLANGTHFCGSIDRTKD